ncbi:hypothetical protein phi9181_ORF069 [Enterococcus phage 9181]|nr:hypothetical protein phi9181_ORF069 [Enterococcus phage 9181]
MTRARGHSVSWKFRIFPKGVVNFIFSGFPKGAPKPLQYPYTRGVHTSFTPDPTLGFTHK